MTASPGLLSSRYRRISIAIYTMVSLSAFENLGVLAATADIAEDLGDVALLPWVITGYLLANSIASVTSGKFIDGVGVRAVFRVGVSVFMAGSLLAALAPSMPLLVAARVVHGIGGGLVFASSLSAVPLVYPAELVGRAYAANATVWGVFGIAGPALAGQILKFASWEWIFLFIIPLGVFASVLAWPTLPGPVEGSRVEIDVRGTALVALTLVGVTVAVGTLSWGSLIPAAMAFIAAAAYLRHARRVEHPIIRLRHLLEPPYGTLNVGIALLLAGAFGGYTYTPLYVAAARGGSDELVAWSVLFVTIGWTAGANGAALFKRRQTVPMLTAAGPAIAVAGLLATAWSVFGARPLWAVFTTLTFVGMGIGVTTNTTLQLLRFATPDAELGRATTTHDFGRNTGFTTGVAIGGSVMLVVLAARLGDVELVRELLADRSIDASTAVADAVAAAYGTALLTGAGIASLSIPILWTLRRRDWQG